MTSQIIVENPGRLQKFVNKQSKYLKQPANWEVIQRHTEAQDQFFEKGLENWNFYVMKNRGP